MKGYQGSKALLPLIPEKCPFQGRHSILENIVANLPRGLRVVVVHHQKDRVIAEAQRLGLIHVEQPMLNGTGGALLAASSLLQILQWQRLIITMGDVPFVTRETYMKLADALYEWPMVVLGFVPEDRKQYGLLETKDGHVARIVEWKYWKDFSEKQLQELNICNAGIYAIRREVLFYYLPLLRSLPHKVKKELDGKWETFPEYFITDLVHFLARDGRPAGYILAPDETEVMGVDDLEALLRAQEIFALRHGHPRS